MASYLLLKHYRGAPAAVNDVPLDEMARGVCSVLVASGHAVRSEVMDLVVDGIALVGAPPGNLARHLGALSMERRPR